MSGLAYQQFDAVADVIGRYFNRVAALSAQSPPPGKNAANGWFRNSMASDAELAAMLSIPQSPTDEKLLRLYGAYQSLNSGLQSAFAASENHSASWTNTGQVFWPALDEFGVEIGAVIAEIFQLLGDDEPNAQQDKSDLGDALNDLFNAVNASDFISHGTHANGWIAGSVDAVGRGVQAHLPEEIFPQTSGHDVDKAAGILRAVAVKLYQINNTEHRPWLRADWQIRFEAIMRTGAAAIKVLREEAAVRASDKGQPLHGDAGRVAANQPHEVAYFARRHGLTRQEVLDLINDVGNKRRDLEAALLRKG